MKQLEPSHRFLRACLRLPVEQTPVWIMRQAGRYLPEYQRVRQEAGDFLALCRNPGLATEVTLQPIRRFALDAAIVFSDILVVPEAMGMNLHFSQGEGPVLDPPIRNRADLDRLRPLDPCRDLGYVMETVALVREKLENRVPLIGFAGSPWTLATYMVEGGSSKDFRTIKGMLYGDPDTLMALLDLLVTALIDYLNAKIDHGAQAIQIFDTWGGVLSPEKFRAFSLTSMKRVIAGLKRYNAAGERIPVILFAKGCTHMLTELADSGCDVVGMDWMGDLGQARHLIGDRVAIQGNMDPAVLYASPEAIREEVGRVLNQFGANPGHIFNLGHGISQDVNPDRVTTLISAVHEQSRIILAQGRGDIR